MSNWDTRFMELAKHVSGWSEDTTKVGCVIVDPVSNTIVSTGFNGLPRNVSKASYRLERPAKYKWVEHAERNAIYNAARLGINLQFCQMYIPWFPCVDCARAIVQSGIQTVVALKPDFNDPKWGEDFTIAEAMFNESGVEVCYYEIP